MKLASLAALLVAGCAAGTATLRIEPAPRVASAQVFFPAAPEVPRYLYAGSLIGEGNYVEEGNATRSRFTQALKWIAGIATGGETPLGLLRPQTGTIDAQGRILVTDASLQAVLVFDPARGLQTWERASGLLKFASPVGIAVSPEGRVWVADSELGFVAELDREGAPVAILGKGLLARPTGVAYDPASRLLYVADTPAHEVKVFDAGRSLVATIGHRGEGDGELNYPTHLAFAHGELYVADTMNSRVQVFSAGKHRFTVGARGLYLGNLVRPKGVTVDSEGNIYVVESYFDHVLVYDRHGKFLLPIGGMGADVGQFYLPAGVWSDARDRIFVADMFNGRVVVMQFLGGGADSEH